MILSPVLPFNKKKGGGSNLMGSSNLTRLDKGGFKMLKKKLLPLFVAATMSLGMVPGLAFAADWQGGAGNSNADGTWTIGAGSKSYTYVNLPAGADITNGFEMSATLDFSGMVDGERAAWSFGINGHDGEYLEEAFALFNCYDGVVYLSQVGSNSADDNAPLLDPAVVSQDDKFDICAQFTPAEDGKLHMDLYANGVKVRCWDTAKDYSAVAGPRYAWLFENTATAGISVSEPIAAVLTAPIPAPVAPWYGDGGVVDNGDGTYTIYGDANGTGPNAKPALPEGADIANGFEMSTVLDLSMVPENQHVGWSFGINSKAGLVDEVTAHFYDNGSGIVLDAMSTWGVQEPIDTVASDNGVFALDVKLTDNGGKLHVAYFVNGVLVNEWDSATDYADVTGPRYAWAYTCPTEGMVVNGVPAAHEVVYIPAKDATCTEPGNIEFWGCLDCDKAYFDKALTKEILSENDVVVLAKGHEFVDGKCKVCGAIQMTDLVPSEPVPAPENPGTDLDDPNKKSDALPQTGDSLPVAAIAFAGIAAAAGAVAYRKMKLS